MAEDNVASEANFVLLTDVAHVEELFVVEDKQVLAAVEVTRNEHGRHWPPHHFLYHEHAEHGCRETSSRAVSHSPHVHIIKVLALGDVHPVLLNWRFEVLDSAVEHVLREELHAEVDGHLVVVGDVPVLLVEGLVVVLCGRVLLCTIQNRHCF